MTTEAPDDANQLGLDARQLGARNSTAHPTSWLAVDGSERVGASPRKTADLGKIVTFSQIHTTYMYAY